jgi:hypothetical protein
MRLPIIYKGLNHDYLETAYRELDKFANDWLKYPHLQKCLETTFACILYYGSYAVLFRGGRSEEVQKLINKYGSMNKITHLVTREHEYIRKKAARELFEDYLAGKNITWERFVILSVRKYLIWNVVTRKEHKRVTKTQKKYSLLSPREQYKLAKVKILVEKEEKLVVSVKAHNRFIGS